MSLLEFIPTATRAPTIADHWREARRLQAICDTYEGDGLPPELDAMQDAEAAVLDGPILSLADAAAKLHAVAYFLQVYENGPGYERAFDDASRWLDAHPN
jgi:hypothetical protein